MRAEVEQKGVNSALVNGETIVLDAPDTMSWRSLWLDGHTSAVIVFGINEREAAERAAAIADALNRGQQ